MTDLSAANIHGVPGGSLRDNGAAKYGQANAWRGQYFERVTA